MNIHDVIAEFMELLEPFVQSAREKILPGVQDVALELAVVALEEELRQYLRERFRLGDQECNLILAHVPESDLEARMDALVDLTALCIALDVNQYLEVFASEQS